MRVKNPIVLLMAVLPAVVSIHAQDSLSRSAPQYLQASFLYDFPGSYGLAFSADKPLLTFTKITNHGKGYTINKERLFFVSGTLAAYRYPADYTAIFALAAAGIRYRKPHHFTELAVSIGVLRTFYDGRVYEVLPGGNIKTLALFGRYYALTGLSYSWNWQLQKKNPKGYYVFLKPKLWAQYPFDSFIKAHASLEAGIRYSLRNVVVKSKTKTKTR